MLENKTAFTRKIKNYYIFVHYLNKTEYPRLIKWRDNISITLSTPPFCAIKVC